MSASPTDSGGLEPQFATTTWWPASTHTAQGCMESSVFRYAAASRSPPPPLSPALFVLVYEAFHQTLTREFSNSTIPAYVDIIAIISPNQREMQRVLERVSQLSAILGLKTNPSKTQVYRWAPPSRREGVAQRESPTRDTITWGDARLLLHPPIFHYLGHHLAHATWEQKARDGRS